MRGSVENDAQHRSGVEIGSQVQSIVRVRAHISLVINVVNEHKIVAILAHYFRLDCVLNMLDLGERLKTIMNFLCFYKPGWNKENFIVLVNILPEVFRASRKNN